MTSNLQQFMGLGMNKAGPEFYAFLLVMLWLGGMALWMWFRYKFPKESAASNTDTPKQSDRDAELKALEGMLRQMLLVQSQTLESMMDTKLKTIKESQEASMKALEHRVDTNQRQEDDRLTRIERTVTEGFRAVHDRLDRHIDSH